MKVRAIYFDLDDTLCGYWDACKTALRAAFEAEGPEGSDADTLIRAWAKQFRVLSPLVKNETWYPVYLKNGGTTRLELMKMVLADVGHPDDARAQRLSDMYGDLRDKNLKLFADAIPVLVELHAKYPLGLITNGPADIQRQEINTLGIGHYFQHFFIEGEVGFGKPVLEVFRRAEAAVGCEPHELLFVGNSYAHDIEPAIKAGWKTIWTRRDSDVAPSEKPGAKPEERPEGAPAPDYEVGDLSSILQLLED